MEVEVDPLSLLEVSFSVEGERLVDIPNRDPIYEVDPLEINIPAALTDSLVAPNIAEIQQKLVNNAESLSQINQNEQFYRHSLYKTLNVVLKKRLHCTICDKHIGCSLEVHDPRVIHPLLRVLICKICSISYNQAEFQIGPSGSDILCRWCGTDGYRLNSITSAHQGLRLCSSCPYAFCERCIYRNFPLDEPGKCNWVCFVCRMNNLWPHRAMCWALVSLLNNLASRKIKDPVWSTDISECCRKYKKNETGVPQQEVPIAPQTLLVAQQVPEKPRVIARRPSPSLVIRKRASPVSVSNGHPRPSASFTPKLSPLIETMWLKSKVKCISANMKVMDKKISAVPDKLGDLETESTISSAMDSLHVVLSLARRQMEAIDEDLKRDWESRKPLHLASNKYANLNGSANADELATETVLQIGELSVNKQHPPETKNNFRSGSSCELFKKYDLKPCFVKLDRCQDT